MSHPAHNTSIYNVAVDPSRPNNAHAFMLEMVGFHKRVLELGCNAGHMTSALIRQDCVVVGVELDRDAADEARALATDVIVGDLDRPETLQALTPGQFDIVLAGDVLEHLRDPTTALRGCRPLLRPGGQLIVSIPNVAHADVRIQLLEGRFRYQPFGLLDSTHLRFFTWQTLLELLHAAGFLPVETKRVRVPIFASEQAVDRERIDPQVIESILQDPEAETYQFVVRALVDDGNSAMIEAVSRVHHLEREMRDRTIECALLQQRLTDSEAQVRVVADTVAALEARAEAAEGAVRAYEHTHLFRRTRQARRLYARIRGLNRRA